MVIPRSAAATRLPFLLLLPLQPKTLSHSKVNPSRDVGLGLKLEIFLQLSSLFLSFSLNFIARWRPKMAILFPLFGLYRICSPMAQCHEAMHDHFSFFFQTKNGLSNLVVQPRSPSEIVAQPLCFPLHWFRFLSQAEG